MSLISDILSRVLKTAPKIGEASSTASKYVRPAEALKGVSKREVEIASKPLAEEARVPEFEIKKTFSAPEEFGKIERHADDYDHSYDLNKGLSDESDIKIDDIGRKTVEDTQKLISETSGKNINFNKSIDDIVNDINKIEDEPSMFSKIADSFKRDESGKSAFSKKFVKEAIDELSDIKYTPQVRKAGNIKIPDVSETYWETKRLGSTAYGKLAEYMEDVERPFISKINNKQEMNAANHIMTAEHLKERLLKGNKIGNLTTQELDNRLLKIKEILGEKRYNEIHKDSQEFVRNASAFRKRHATMSGEANLTGEDVFKKWEEKYKWYVPSVHSDELIKQAFGDASDAYNKNGITGVRLDFMKMAGNRVFEPDHRAIERLREGTARMFMTQERIKVNRIAAREFGVPVKFEKKIIGNKSINVPVNLPAGYIVMPNLIVDTKKSGNIAYAFPKEVADVLSQIGKRQADVITDAMGEINRAWKEMATAYRLPFTFMNVFRDMHDSIMNEKLTEAGINVPSVFLKPSIIIKSFWSSFRKNVLGGFKSSFTKSVLKDEIYDDVIKEGLPYGGRFSRGGLTETPFHILDWKKKSYRVITYPLAFLHDMSVAAEQGWRIAQYKRFDGTNISKALRVGLGRNITVDFEKMGHSTRVINKMIPFFNANLQGFVNIAENFKTQPKTTAVKMFGFLSVMSSVYLYNKLNDEDDFNKVDPYLKDNYWLMNSGLKTKGRPYYMSVAGLPRSATAIWQPIRQAIDLYIEKNPDKRKEMQENLKETFLSTNAVRPFAASMLPPAVKTPFEMYSNYDLFRGRNIEPVSTEGLSTELRSRPSTPNIYRRMAQIPGMSGMGMSPAKIAHGISGAAPAVRQVESPIDFVLDKLLGTENLLDPMKKDEVSSIDEIGRIVPFIKATHYDPELESAYKNLRSASTVRRDKMYLTKQYYDAWKAGDDDAEAKYKLLYRNLDRNQRMAIERYKKDKKLESRIGRAQYKMKKAPLAIRLAINSGVPEQSSQDILGD